MTDPKVATVGDAPVHPSCKRPSACWVEPVPNPRFDAERNPRGFRDLCSECWFRQDEEESESIEPGPVEASVRADLNRLGRLEEGVRGSLAQMALRLARAYDLCADADLAQLARANMELRQTLSRIAEVGDDGDGGEAARISTPDWDGPAAVRDGSKSGPADAGAADGGGSAAPG